MATLVGLARIEQNVHWASDVMAGAIIGTAVGKTVVHLNGPRGHDVAFVPLSSSTFYGMAVELAL